MTRKRLAIFLHVEKCGGTSLITMSRRRRVLGHCDLVMKNPRTNRATEKDFELALQAYPRLDFISGHCIDPADVPEFKSIALNRGYDDVYAFTVLRNPLARCLSDYVHDFSRRESMLSFESYLQIQWKQNYLVRFFGESNPRQATDALNSLDLVDTEGGIRAQQFLAANGFDFAALESPRSNVFEGTPPPCLKQADGMKLGKYSISKSDLLLLREVNQKDTALFEGFASMNNEFRSHSPGNSISETKSRPLYQRLFRNMVYKPLFARRLGSTILPRNSIPAEQVGFDGPSIWSDVATVTHSDS